ncbi:MAG: S9 family peptidase [Xanthomonadales bacterium]|jgi:dipeptidyl aminopeptidase/acylaminoacyl peptidase|nr:S9 family peptidase [Xanthomonadales bacterium]
MKPGRALPTLLVLLALAAGAPPAEAVEPPERLSIDHRFELGTLSDPTLSPDGAWIAYTVSRESLEDDRSRSRIWMVPAAGGEPVSVTAEHASSWSPRWSPDGQTLGFLSSRDGGETQVWTLDRRGGDAVQLTDTPQSVSYFAWSPDARHLALVLQDLKPEHRAAIEAGEEYEEKTRPWVIDRVHFKQDYVGYLDRRREHIYRFDLADRSLHRLTEGDFDNSSPAWSPDGTRIAFASNRTPDADLNQNTDIWVVPAHPEGDDVPPALQITDHPGTDAAPRWSPDGRTIVHRAMTTPDRPDFAVWHLALSPVDGGPRRVLTADLDRMIYGHGFDPDGEKLWFWFEDAGSQVLATIDLATGAIERHVDGQDVVDDFAVGADGRLALLLRRPLRPAEVFLYDGELHPRTAVNEPVLSGIELGDTVKIAFEAEDGWPVEAMVVKPPGFREDRRYPVIVDLHGGPVAQRTWGFSFNVQLWAAHGYLVVQPNFRGSSGYGFEHTNAIWRDWGGPDTLDTIAAADAVVERGWADPDRMAVTGWSYGGILTNHVITKTNRFAAAVTGASATLYVVNYGHDMYVSWWENELGVPWEPEARARYERVSPFNRVTEVTTPTLIVGGEKDWNVPIINSEQLYLALKRLGVPTELVVYPDEFHGIDTPSLAKDLAERYLAWFDRYLGDREG